MKILPETLRKLRKRNGLSQQGLADKARIDKKTVARIEGGKGGEPRGSTVKEIASALDVEPQVLAQEPESEAVREADLRKHGLRMVRLPFYGETILAYDLVSDRYGVDMRQIIDAAPMLFTLLAEMSLADRRRCLEEAEKALDAFNQALPEHLTGCAWSYSDDEKSIAERDLFCRLENDEWNSSYQGRNPFSDFLIQLAKGLGPDNDAINHEDICNLGNFDDLPSFSLFKAFLKNLTGGSSRADYALSCGYVRLGQIPKQLRGEDEEDERVVSERVKWLEAQVPDDDWAEWASIDISSFLITKESPSEGGTEDA